MMTCSKAKYHLDLVKDQRKHAKKGGDSRDLIVKKGGERSANAHFKK